MWPGTFIGNYLDCTSIGYDIAKIKIYANNKYSSKENFYIRQKYAIKRQTF